MPRLSVAQRRLRQLIDRLEPLVRQRVEQALRDLQRAIPEETLVRVLTNRDAFLAHDLVGTLPVRLRPMLAELQRVFQAGVQAGEADLPTQMRVRLRFDQSNPYVIRAAQDMGGAAITGITAQTRAAIRTVIGRSVADGIPIRQAAKLLRPLIGLSERQAGAVLAYRRTLLGEGVSQETMLQKITAYAAELLRYRALLIARTEVIAASTQGQIAAWTEAQAQGYLSPGSEKLWIVTADDRLCPYCAAMDGQRVPLDSSFAPPATLAAIAGNEARVAKIRQRRRLKTTGKGWSRFGHIAGPPLHPNCRCAVGIVPVAVTRAA